MHVDVFVPKKKPVGPSPAEVATATRLGFLGSNDLRHPWACEPADDRTMQQLTHLAGVPLHDLQWRRNPYDVHCPERVPPTRRRCVRCPFWQRHPELTPFDGAPSATAVAAAVGGA